MKDLRIVLDEEGFRKLVRGEAVEQEITVELEGRMTSKGTVKIILSDMGYHVMLGHIKQALEDNCGL